MIYIIEDVSEISSLMAMYLAKAQMEAREFGAAEDAMAAIESGENPDLVILDLNLPGMSGFDFLDKYRRRASAPVIIVSARDADEDIVKALGIGADEFVTKPFSPKALVARAKALLRRKAL